MPQADQRRNSEVSPAAAVQRRRDALAGTGGPPALASSPDLKYRASLELEEAGSRAEAESFSNR